MNKVEVIKQEFSESIEGISWEDFQDTTDYEFASACLDRFSEDERRIEKLSKEDDEKIQLMIVTLDAKLAAYAYDRQNQNRGRRIGKNEILTEIRKDIEARMVQLSEDMSNYKHTTREILGHYLNENAMWLSYIDKKLSELGVLKVLDDAKQI